MSKEETLLQAKAMFEKTLENYYNFLEQVYLDPENRQMEEMYVEVTKKKFSDKLKLISSMSRKYGNLKLDVPFLSNKVGNC